MAALGGDDDDIAPVLDVDQRRGAPSPALGADAVEQQHRRRAGEPMADESGRRTVDPRMASHQSAQHGPGQIGEALDVHPGSLRPKGDQRSARDALIPRDDSNPLTSAPPCRHSLVAHCDRELTVGSDDARTSSDGANTNVEGGWM